MNVVRPRLVLMWEPISERRPAAFKLVAALGTAVPRSAFTLSIPSYFCRP